MRENKCKKNISLFLKKIIAPHSYYLFLVSSHSPHATTLMNSNNVVVSFKPNNSNPSPFSDTFASKPPYNLLPPQTRSTISLPDRYPSITFHHWPFHQQQWQPRPITSFHKLEWQKKNYNREREEARRDRKEREIKIQNGLISSFKQPLITPST